MNKLQKKNYDRFFTSLEVLLAVYYKSNINYIDNVIKVIKGENDTINFIDENLILCHNKPQIAE